MLIILHLRISLDFRPILAYICQCQHATLPLGEVGWGAATDIVSALLLILGRLLCILTEHAASSLAPHIVRTSDWRRGRAV